MNTVPIVLICDNNFVMQTSVAITSLLNNKAPETSYTIYVVGDNLTEESKQKLQSISSEQNIKIIDADSADLKDLHPYANSPILSATKAALLKFELPQIFSEEKIIYLDGDIIVKDDLTELYETNIDRYYVAAAHDTGKLYFKSAYHQKIPNYFNSGVMLLNLALMRKNNITEKLIQTKLSIKDSTLMDQNTLNIVFEGKVKIIDIKWNFLALNLYRAKNKWDINDINYLFESKYKDFDDIKNKSKIIHFSSKEKPWLYKDVLFADVWYKYYKKSPYKSKKLKRKTLQSSVHFWENIFSIKRENETQYTLRFLGLKIKYKSAKNVIKILEYKINVLESMHKLGINKEKICCKIENFNSVGITEEKREESLIVSLTSYPDRMYDIHYCIYSLLNQKTKPDKVILWLSEEQFPNKEKDIPQKVLNLINNGLTIEWCEDLKSYKKLIPALNKYPNAIIVTADDDIYYADDWLEKIYNTYLRSGKKCVVAHRCHKFGIQKNKILSYSKWEKCVSCSTNSFTNFPTGAGGVLYKKDFLYKDICDKNLFQKLAPNGDDIWFWAMTVLNKTKIQIVPNSNELIYINPEREFGFNSDKTLLEQNINGGNDKQINEVLKYYPEITNIITKY